MSDTLGKNTSLWIDTTVKTKYPTLSSNETTCDVLVIGGGITGIISAWLLQNEGLNVVLIEKDRLVEYTTGNTTAKLTSQHYLVYNHLVEDFGEETARAFAKANQDAIEKFESISRKLGIDCDFSRRDAYVYTESAEKLAEIKREVEVTQMLGLPSSLETTTDLPFPVKGAIKFANQAQFHPRKFLLPLVEEFVTKGGKVYEQTEAVDIKPGDPNVVETKNGRITAKYIVEAVKESFWQEKLFEKAAWIKISYALGVRLRGDYPQGMYITTDDPIRSIRSHPYKDGQLLIFGGESHKLEGDLHEDEHYNNLLRDVQKRFDVESVEYRWLAGDVMPYDLMPYIGEYPNYPNVYVATGFRAWGLAWGMAAAHIITDKIMSRPVPWAEPFGLGRLTT